MPPRPARSRSETRTNPFGRFRRAFFSLLGITLLLSTSTPAFASTNGSSGSSGSSGSNDGSDTPAGETVTTVPGQRPPTRPIVTAAQAPIVKDENGNWLIPLVRAGTAATLTLSSTDESTEFDLPIPAGLQPVELRGMFDPKGESAAATLAAKIGGRDFTLSAPDRLPTPFTFDLEGLQAPKKIASTMGGGFELKAESDLECPRVTSQPAQISDLVLVLAGDTAAPTSVAEFLPPILDRVIIDVPEPITEDIAEGVLKLTARLVSRYSDQPVAVLVRSAKTAPALKAEPFTRHFRLIEAPLPAKPSIKLAKPTNGEDTVMELRGTGDAFGGAAEFIGSQAFTTSFTNEVTFKPGKSNGSKKARAKQFRVNLDQLRRGTTAQGVNRAKVQFSARQSDVGGPSVRMTLRITGRVIAISGPTRKATVRLSANGRALASKDVALGDGFTLTGAIDPRVVTRENQVVVESDAILDSSGFSTAKCTAGAVIRLELDANSIISSEAGVAVEAGFDRFPQAFHNGFDVAMSPMNIDELAAASYLVAGLQEHAQPMLEPNVVDWPTSPLKNPSLLVGGTVAQVQRLRPPLVPGPLTIESGGTGVGAVASGGTPQTLTALEAFETKGVDQLLLATSAKTTELSKLADKVRSLQGGWTRLSGDVYVLADGETRMARLRADNRPPLPLPGQKPKPKPRSPFVGVTIGGLASLGALGFWVLLRRLYRRYSRPIRA
jgi:hypothetical protein